MRTRVKRLLGLMLLVLLAGCSIKHPVAADYARYLENNRGAAQFAAIDADARYTIDPATVAHRLEFRSGKAGTLHLWIVEFGAILEDTLRSDDVQQVFRSLTPGTAGGGLQLAFRLQDYRFAGSQAHIELEISAVTVRGELLRRSYSAKGLGQSGKTFFGGPFAFKNAIQQSTKSALDQILAQFFQELRAAL